jgi:hypothetical protein
MKDALDGSGVETEPLGPGDNSTPFQVDPVNDLTRLYIRTNEQDENQAGIKRPQADVEIGTVEGSNCADSSVSVLALNTEG